MSSRAANTGAKPSRSRWSSVVLTATERLTRRQCNPKAFCIAHFIDAYCPDRYAVSAPSLSRSLAFTAGHMWPSGIMRSWQIMPYCSVPRHRMVARGATFRSKVWRSRRNFASVLMRVRCVKRTSHVWPIYILQLAWSIFQKRVLPTIAPVAASDIGIDCGRACDDGDLELPKSNVVHTFLTTEAHHETHLNPIRRRQSAARHRATSWSALTGPRRTSVISSCS